MTALLKTLLALAVDLTFSWWVMILIGVAHSTDDRVPALGYTTTLCLFLALTVTVSVALFHRDLRKL